MPEAFVLHTTKSDNAVPKQNMMHQQNIDYQNQVIQLELQRAKQLSLQIKQMHENESTMSGSGGNLSHLSNSNASGSGSKGITRVFARQRFEERSKEIAQSARRRPCGC